MKLNLKVVRRKNVSGIKCAAPYINGSNVWDIPEKQWTASVQQAVARAYQLGVSHTLLEIRNTVLTPGITEPE